VAHLQPVDFSNARAIVTHERIAKALHDVGFGVVLLSRPDVVDVLRSLESMP
jgi:uroporphyrinogen-III synthase